MSFLKNLQSKSSSTKAQYALAISGVVTGFIAIVWVSTLPAHFSEMTGTEIVQKEESESFLEVFNDAKSQLGNVIDWNEDTQSIDDAPQYETDNMDALGTTEAPREETILPTQREVVENNDEQSGTPGIIMPQNVVPQENFVNASTTSWNETNTNENVIQIATRTPKVILIGTSTEGAP